MKRTWMVVMLGMVLTASLLCGEMAVASAADAKDGSLDDILDRVEAKYAGPGFSVRFDQTSMLKAMNISDSAAGHILIKRPGMMRWEYETPNVQLIIADPKEIWIYRPEDSQAMHGAAPEFFKGGNGAGFLSDMSRIRKDFQASMEAEGALDGGHHIKLVPREKSYDVEVIFLVVSPVTYEINTLSTLNAYGDETRFELTDYKFDQAFPSELFEFKVPEGVDVLTLDQ